MQRRPSVLAARCGSLASNTLLDSESARGSGVVLVNGIGVGSFVSAGARREANGWL